MIKSMTGYGRAVKTLNSNEISVEIRSVNHRYLDLNIKVPRHLSFLEENVRSFVSSNVSRGKLDVYVSVFSRENDDKTVVLKSGLAKNYIDALATLKKDFSLKGNVTVDLVASFPDIFEIQRKEIDEEAIWSDVSAVLKDAVSDYNSMREREGERLARDLNQKADNILSMVKEIEVLSPQSENAYRQRLEEKIKELLSNNEIDESRILTEVAIFSDKIAVDEEIVRLKSHFEEMRALVANGNSIGRKLDFIIQEMNRETNTIGSKANNIEITKNVVNIKSEIEKLREQVQNIE